MCNNVNIKKKGEGKERKVYVIQNQDENIGGKFFNARRNFITLIIIIHRKQIIEMKRTNQKSIHISGCNESCERQS